jgi:outer membrane lipoprotein-sorting protein
MVYFVFWLGLVLPQTRAATPALSADQIVAKVQAFYESTPHLRAKFRQTVINKTFGPRPPSDGKVYIKKPDKNAAMGQGFGKMRWEYYGQKSRNRDRKVIKSFLSDGKTLWAVFHEDKAYYVKPIESDLLPVVVTFLSGKGDLTREFNTELEQSGKYGDAGDLVVKLTPKTPSAQYKYLWLVVDPTEYRVKQSIVVNAQDEENAFRFFEPDLKTTIPDSYFVFNPKANRDYKLMTKGKDAG